jgi:primase-polymerase (primpol)-like protein
MSQAHFEQGSAAQTQAPNCPEGELYLGDFASQPVWVAWRNETRTNKRGGQQKWTKVPYCGDGKYDYAKSNDPSTWVDIDKAHAVMEKKVNGHGGGIGIIIGI